MATAIPFEGDARDRFFDDLKARLWWTEVVELTKLAHYYEYSHSHQTITILSVILYRGDRLMTDLTGRVDPDTQEVHSVRLQNPPADVRLATPLTLPKPSRVIPPPSLGPFYDVVMNVWWKVSASPTHWPSARQAAKQAGGKLFEHELGEALLSWDHPARMAIVRASIERVWVDSPAPAPRFGQTVKLTMDSAEFESFDASEPLPQLIVLPDDHDS